MSSVVEEVQSELVCSGRQATLESYEAMPIEEFGEALMRGMGWSEGRPVGRNAAAKVRSLRICYNPTRDTTWRSYCACISHMFSWQTRCKAQLVTWA